MKDLKRLYIQQSGKEKSHNRMQFLLTLFPNQGNWYAEMPLNGFVLVRYHNGNKNVWEVAIYTQESYKRYKEWRDIRSAKLEKKSQFSNELPLVEVDTSDNQQSS